MLLLRRARAPIAGAAAAAVAGAAARSDESKVIPEPPEFPSEALAYDALRARWPRDGAGMVRDAARKHRRRT